MKNSRKLSKQEIEQRIKEIFLKKPNPREIKKAKQLAMSKNIKLASFKKMFCKKCLTIFTSTNSKIRIKNKFKIIKCENCGYINKWWMR
ncbi:MAG: hypothetical protein AABW90_03820 [Nanoarchaeota archaeon]